MKRRYPPKTQAELRRANRGNVPGVLGMAEMELLMRNRPHEWTGPNQVVRHCHCSLCGVIQRLDGGNGPCKGAAPKIVLR